MLTKLFQTIMAAPTIGTYTEKRIANQINILTKRLDELENNIKTPPFVIIYGVMDIPSEFTTDWKAHVNHILALNNIALPHHIQIQIVHILFLLTLFRIALKKQFSTFFPNILDLKNLKEYMLQKMLFNLSD